MTESSWLLVNGRTGQYIHCVDACKSLSEEDTEEKFQSVYYTVLDGSYSSHTSTESADTAISVFSATFFERLIINCTTILDDKRVATSNETDVKGVN